MIFKTYIYSILALENEILVYLSGNILSMLICTSPIYGP